MAIYIHKKQQQKTAQHLHILTNKFTVEHVSDIQTGHMKGEHDTAENEKQQNK